MRRSRLATPPPHPHLPAALCAPLSQCSDESDIYVASMAGTELEVRCSSPGTALSEAPRPIIRDNMVPWGRVHENLIDAQLLNKMSSFMEQQRSSLYSQQPTTDPVLSRLNLVHVFPIFKIRFNTTFSSTSRSPKWAFPSKFPPKLRLQCLPSTPLSILDAEC